MWECGKQKAEQAYYREEKVLVQEGICSLIIDQVHRSTCQWWMLLCGTLSHLVLFLCISGCNISFLSVCISQMVLGYYSWMMRQGMTVLALEQANWHTPHFSRCQRRCRLMSCWRWDIGINCVETVDFGVTNQAGQGEGVPSF